MKTVLRILLPLAVLAGAVLVAQRILASASAPDTAQPVSPPPLVRVVPVERVSLTLDVLAHGTVVPRTQSRLVPQVGGRVVEVSPAFVAGGFFEPGDVLLRLDRRDYELLIVRAQAAVARAERLLALEQNEAEVARAEWHATESGQAGELVLRVPQLAEAHANLLAARAELDRAHLDLQRTDVSAPFAGRVRSRQVDLGQSVLAGAELAVIYAVDRAEIRLPVPDSELAFLDLQPAHRGAPQQGTELPVQVTAQFAGQLWTWPGRLVRTEGEIDPSNRMLHLVVEVNDPYGASADGRPPLAVGLFTECRIEGRRLDDALVIPRAALRRGNEVLLVDAANTLRRRSVSPLRVERERVILSAGVEPGELLCTSILESSSDGMAVRPQRDELP